MQNGPKGTLATRRKLEDEESSLKRELRQRHVTEERRSSISIRLAQIPGEIAKLLENHNCGLGEQLFQL